MKENPCGIGFRSPDFVAAIERKLLTEHYPVVYIQTLEIPRRGFLSIKKTDPIYII